MRRKEREITDEHKIEALIAKTQIMRVGFLDEGEIYIVPVNYGYVKEDGKYIFYFHGAKAGRKYELSKNGPQVGFELDGSYGLITGELACEYSAEYESIVGNGKITLVEDAAEKELALNAVVKQASGKADWEYSEKMLSATAVFRMDVTKMSCKAH